MKVPYVFGAAIGLEGNLSVFSPPETPCLECVMPNLSDTDLQTCNTRGVLGATPGIIGAMQAMETVKLIAGVGSPLKGKLMVCDFSDMSFATVDVSRNASCPACHGEIAAGLPREKLVWLCGLNTANINPEKPLKFTLNEVYETIKTRGFKVTVKSTMVIVFEYKNLQISLFNGGRMLIKSVTNEKSALKAYREIAQTLSLS
jgi:adenylyltransferase/sulfurtransferase